jgi:acetylornithine deacetylase/succinyl-diaminopimelate desuccinylase-like protein
MADQVAQDEAVALAAQLIKIDTTNRGGGDGCERPAAELVAAALSEAGLDPVLLESSPGRANVVARMAGADPSAPALLVHGHLDVVPAEPADWTVPPFSGEIRDGVLWGRGAVDMKNAVAVMVAVARSLARTGRKPARDVVLAFTADEEDTAAYGAAFLAAQHAGLFDGCTEGISESGGFTFHAAPGVRLYPVASAERGTAWLKLTAHGTAGHGSRRNPRNAVTILAKALARIGDHQWPVRIIPTVRAALAALADAAGASADEIGLAEHSLDEHAPGPDELAARLGPSSVLVANVLRNSTNPTMLSAGYKVNVIPGEATAFVDGRVLPGGEEEFAAVLDKLTGPDVDWEYYHVEAPLEAPLDAPLVSAMTGALLAEDPGARVVPYCMAGGTDAKHFARLGIAGYGFTPLALPPGYDYHAMFHGVDERVPISALHFGVRVMERVLTSPSGGSGGSSPRAGRASGGSGGSSPRAGRAAGGAGGPPPRAGTAEVAR